MAILTERMAHTRFINARILTPAGFIDGKISPIEWILAGNLITIYSGLIDTLEKTNDIIRNPP